MAEFLKAYSNRNTWNTRKLLILCKRRALHIHTHKNIRCIRIYLYMLYIDNLGMEWHIVKKKRKARERQRQREREIFKEQRNRLIWIKSCWWTIEICCCCAHALWDHKFYPTASESHTLIHIDAKATRLHFVWTSIHQETARLLALSL